jgi:hypothetical protein
MTAETAKVLSMNETVEVEAKALALPEKARLIVVDSVEKRTVADNTVKDLDAMIKEVRGVFDPLADKANAAHKAITSKRGEILKPLEDAKTYLTSQVRGYDRKVKEAAEAEELRLNEIARQQEEERRIAEAEQAEKEGCFEEAQEIIEAPIYVAPVKVMVDLPKLDNRKYAVRPKARIVNKLDVIKSVANNPALLDLVDINISVANAKARALGKELGKVIRGLEYFEE